VLTATIAAISKSSIGLGNVPNVDCTNASNISTGTLATARMGSGTANSASYLRGDNTWQAISSSTGANPSAPIGLTAVNGSASTFMRSDGAPALSVAIAPTWTGNHTWNPTSDGQSVIRLNQSNGTRSMSIGTFPSGPTYGGIWIGSATPSASNYAFLSDGADVIFNSTATVIFRTSNTTRATISSTALTIASGHALKLGNAATTGLTAGTIAATTNATITITDSTGQVYRIPCII
jgi:hypothetical protein